MWNIIMQANGSCRYREAWYVQPTMISIKELEDTYTEKTGIRVVVVNVFYVPES